MNWMSKHFYGSVLTTFILFFFISYIFYNPFISSIQNLIPIIIFLYLIGYILLPWFRRFGKIKEKLEKPTLECIAKILNESLKNDKELQEFLPKNFQFKHNNAFVRIISDYTFREYCSRLVFDRVKTSIADYYFYSFMAIGFRIGLFLTGGGFIIYYIILNYFPNFNILNISFKTMFFEMPLQKVIMFVIILGFSSFMLNLYFNNISDNHRRRIHNMMFLIINKQKNEIEGLIHLLKEDQNLLSIAKEDIEVP